MKKEVLMSLLKQDLNRTGVTLDDDYLSALIQTAISRLVRQGIRLENNEEYQILIVGTAAWMYRKRINGEAMPMYLRAMRNDILVSQKMRVVGTYDG